VSVILLVVSKSKFIIKLKKEIAKKMRSR